MRRVYPSVSVSVSSPSNFHTPDEQWASIPRSGAFQASSMAASEDFEFEEEDYQPVVEEPETPVTKNQNRFSSGAFSFTTCVSVEETVGLSITSPTEEVEISTSPVVTSVSPSATRHGKIHPFAGGRRRASITAISNSGFGSALEVSVALEHAGRRGAGGLARMMALGEIESRGGSDVEDSVPVKKGGLKPKRWGKGSSGFLMADPTSSDEDDVFKFEKLPVSSYSSSPSLSASDNEISRPVSPMPMKRSGLCELLESQKLEDEKKKQQEEKAEPKEAAGTYEIELDEEFVSEDVLAETVAAEQDHPLDHEHRHHEKVCADDFEKIKTLGKGTYVISRAIAIAASLFVRKVSKV